MKEKEIHLFIQQLRPGKEKNFYYAFLSNWVNSKSCLYSSAHCLRQFDKCNCMALGSWFCFPHCFFQISTLNLTVIPEGDQPCLCSKQANGFRFLPVPITTTKSSCMDVYKMRSLMLENQVKHCKTCCCFGMFSQLFCFCTPFFYSRNLFYSQK